MDLIISDDRNIDGIIRVFRDNKIAAHFWTFEDAKLFYQALIAQIHLEGAIQCQFKSGGISQ